MWSIVGFFLPIIGIILFPIFKKKNEYVFRSIRRGSAISSILVVLALSIFIYYIAFH